MKLLLKLILNRFILSILLLFFFSLDYKMVRLNPFEYYSVTRPPISAVADGYYIIEFGETDIYIEVTYLDGLIHLVPKSNVPDPSLVQIQPLVAWYYYGLLLALANIIPFSWFMKSSKPKKRKK